MLFPLVRCSSEWFVELLSGMLVSRMFPSKRTLVLLLGRLKSPVGLGACSLVVLQKTVYKKVALYWTMSVPTISECPGPQGTEQKNLKVPVLSGVNVKVSVIPGSTIWLTLKSGRPKP